MPEPVSEAVNYITKADWRQSRLGLERMQTLMRLLGNPQDKLKFVHIAGTNGKSSTACMLASVLCAANYKVGLYTSPYINVFNERMQVNGANITTKKLNEVTAIVREKADTMSDHPTEFELVTAIAFVWFLREECDIVVLEVGLGGRLDATNIIKTPLLAIITTISQDHTQQLGNTLQQIAGEKAGIIKKGGIVLLYPQTKEVNDVFEVYAADMGATIHRLYLNSLKTHGGSLDEGQSFDYDGKKDIKVKLLGPYQTKNAAMVISAVSILNQSGFVVSEGAMREGLYAAKWPARFELISKAPDVIVDGGHNPEGASMLIEGLKQYYPGKKVILLAGVMRDKDFSTTYKLVLPYVSRVFCVTPNNQRALPAKELAGFFAIQGMRAQAFDTVTLGLKAALSAAKPNDVVCAFGSFYMAGDIRSEFWYEQ